MKIVDMVFVLLMTLVFSSGYVTGLTSGMDKCPTQPIIWEHTTVPQAKEF